MLPMIHEFQCERDTCLIQTETIPEFGAFEWHVVNMAGAQPSAL
jgi:hypothetical protein